MTRQNPEEAAEAIARANERPQDGWGCWSYTADSRILILRTFYWSGPPAPRYLLLHRPTYAYVPWSIGPVVFALKERAEAADGPHLPPGADSSDLWVVSLRTPHAEYQVLCEKITYFEEAAA